MTDQTGHVATIYSADENQPGCPTTGGFQINRSSVSTFDRDMRITAEYAVDVGLIRAFAVASQQARDLRIRESEAQARERSLLNEIERQIGVRHD